MTSVIVSMLNTIGGVFAALLNTFWIAAAMAALAWIALRFLPRVNAATRYGVWWAVLVAIVAVPLAPRLLPEKEIPAEIATVQPAPVVPATGSIKVIVVPEASIASTPPEPAPVRLSAGQWIVWATAIWAAFFAFRMIRIGRSYISLRCIKQRAQPPSREQRLNFDTWLMAASIDRPVRLLISKEVESPIAVGFARPAVILPEPLLQEFTPEELDHVLLHELAHMARLDDWTNLFARTAQAVLGLHPVAAWVISRIDHERESACDDWVVSMTGEARPYAASLTRVYELANSRRQVLASGMAERGSRLRERIEKLLQKGREFKPGLSMETMGVGAAVLVGLVLAGSQSPVWVAFAQDRVPPAPVAPTAPAVPAPPANAVVPPVPATPRVLGTVPEAAPVPLRAINPLRDLSPRELDEFRQMESEAQIIQAQVSAQEREVERLLERLRPEHPDVQAREAQIHALNAQLEALRSHGLEAFPQVRAFYQAPTEPRKPLLSELSEAGMKDLSVDEIIDMARSGVRPDFMKAMTEAGFQNLTREQFIQLARSGVTPDYLRALRAGGFNNLTVEQAINAARSGVRADDIKIAKEYNSSLSLEDIIRLKRSGAL